MRAFSFVSLTPRTLGEPGKCWPARAKRTTGCICLSADHRPLHCKEGRVAQPYPATSRHCGVAKPSRKGLPMIYVLQIEDHRFVKIGFTSSSDVSGRVATLQTGCPYEIKPVMTVDGSLAEEKSLHRELELALGMLRLPAPPNEWYPGKHFFMRLVLAELRFGAQTAITFIRAYLESRRCGRSGESRAASSWKAGAATSPEHFAQVQESVTRSLPNGSSASLIKGRMDKRERVAPHVHRQRQLATNGTKQAEKAATNGRRGS